jgi:HEPN domain-containing protein
MKEVKNKKTIKMAESFLKRAWNKLDEAKNQLKSYRYPESLSASQECIEMSIKGIFLLLQEKYPKKHEFEEEEFVALLEKVPKNPEFEYLNFPQLYLFSKFWSNFYTVAKYGYEKLGIGPEKLFEKEEAELALKHADKCLHAANRLENYLKYGY